MIFIIHQLFGNCYIFIIQSGYFIHRHFFGCIGRLFKLYQPDNGIVDDAFKFGRYIVANFLTAFFFYNAGVNAVLFLASVFAEKVLHFTTKGLILLVLILQIVAVGGAWLSTKVSDRKGNKFSLMIQLVIWTAICATGYWITSGLEFYLLAAGVGLVMGGIQALSRSTYAKLLPENTPDTASYFSFYDVMDKVSTVAGTFVFGFVEQIVRSSGIFPLEQESDAMRFSVLALAIFFIVSLFVLAAVRVRRMVVEG